MSCSPFPFQCVGVLLSFISRQLLKVHMVKTSAATFMQPLLGQPSTSFLYCSWLLLQKGFTKFEPVHHSPAPFSE
uniref:Uncharacterized protein n=1 Tax=Oryza brachyantha TaxID=4533 RepID=J3N207_ORYBR